MHFYFPRGLVVVALLPLRRSQEASRVFLLPFSLATPTYRVVRFHSFFSVCSASFGSERYGRIYPGCHPVRSAESGLTIRWES